MESEISLGGKGGSLDVVVEIHSPKPNESPPKDENSKENGDSASKTGDIQMKMNLFNTAAAAAAAASTQAAAPPPAQLVIPAPSLDSSSKPPPTPDMRRRTSAYSKPKSRIAEPPFTSSLKSAEPTPASAKPPPPPRANSPNVASSSPSSKPNSGTPKTSAPITPRTPLIGSAGDSDDEDDDEDVYNTDTLKPQQAKRGKKVKAMRAFEWMAFVSITTLLILSKTVNKLKNEAEIWSLQLWKWCVLVLVIFCGHLFTDWVTNLLVFLIERNFLLKKKVLYFVFALKKSVRIVIWLALILVAWVLLINRGVRRSRKESDILNKITRGIVSTLVGAVMWMVKTLLVKIVASTFHVKTYFDRIQESIFHQYILEALSGNPIWDDASESYKSSGRLSFNKAGKQQEQKEKEKGEQVINVDKLYKIKREKVSAWTMGGLMNVIRNSDFLTISEILDESAEEEASGGQKVITSEVEARRAANTIFKRVAKRGHKYIEEDDILRYMPKEEVDNVFPLFEGAAESRRIKKSAFRNWVVKAHNERKCLAVSLKDAKTAIEELNKIASGLVLVVIIIVWILLMEIATTSILVFISSQMLLVVFMFGNTAKTVFEAMIFVFVVHPFDVGDRCVIDGVQMVVDEMNILTTIFLKGNNEKLYYPNAILATKAISNYNRSPEMMGDAVEFAVDFSTSVESLAALRAKIKGKPSMKLDVLASDSHGRFTSAVSNGPDSSAKVKSKFM
ncbi:mechanosensitive ion channel protein 10-like isoform X2 [Salvia miltiorrhiza]|uniref:mechanosensitive ion channel protein 10-like isoform X2 n=1 Tax=Salvia miltiorrhiza TaxID=226208 RepID=UPI0025AC102A|nr:mechanosensitive ion channel protein 10-like isoform X2 [Salvia miltiorrhiza]